MWFLYSVAASCCTLDSISIYPETHTGMSSCFTSFVFAPKFLSVGFALFLYVFLTFFCPFLGMCKQSLAALCLFSRSLCPMHTHAEGASRPQCYAHRHDSLWLTLRPVQTMGATHVAKWDSRREQWDTPAFCSLIYTLAFTYKYINTYTWLCCHDSRFPVFQHGAFPMQKEFIKKQTCPPLFLLSCQLVFVDWFPSAAVNVEGLCLLAFGCFCTLIQPTKEIGWSQPRTSLDGAGFLINLEAMSNEFVQLCLPLLVLS